MKPDRLMRTTHAVSNLLKGRVRLFRGDFKACIRDATPDDLVYMDPPYQGTSHGPDKRYAAQIERETLIEALHDLDGRGVPYMLSYDGRTGDKTYGDPLPTSVRAHRMEVDAGRSSQATLNGKDSMTIESLYVSYGLNGNGTHIFDQLPFGDYPRELTSPN